MNKIKIIIFITTTIVILTFLLSATKNTPAGNLVSPFINPLSRFDNKTVEGETVSTPNAPETFEFNSTTDLKLEFEKVNPGVYDSDFE